MFSRRFVGNGRKEKGGLSEHELKGLSTNPNNSSSTDTSASDVPKKRNFLSFGKNKVKKRPGISSPVSPVSADSWTDVHSSNSGNVGEPVIRELDHEMKSLGNSGKNCNKSDLEGASPKTSPVKETVLPVESEEVRIRRKRLLEEMMKQRSRQPLQHTGIDEEANDDVHAQVEGSLGERGRLEMKLEDEQDKVHKMEEDLRANVEEKLKLKEENETLNNKVQELTEALKNVLKPVNTTDPSLPECDVDRKCHSLPPSHGTRVVINGVACIELHDDMHSSEVKQSVDAVRAKGNSSDYTPEGRHVSATTSQHTPDALKRQHEEAISKAFKENCKLKNQLSEMTKENKKLQAEKQQLILSSRTTMREAQSEKEHTLKTLKEKTSNLEANNRKLTKDLDVAREELDAAKEEIDARIQHEVKITRDLRASIEEKSRFEKILKELQDQCGALQLQLELNKGDFEQERNDRATAAGRYDEEKQHLLKTIEDMRQNMKNKDDQVSKLSEQFRHSTSSSQGLEHKLQRQETEYRKLEQQLKREIDQLKQQQTKLNKELTQKTQELTRRSPKQTRGGRSGRDEDTDLRIAKLKSVKSHLTEENKRQMREFQNRETYSRQLEQQLRGTIHQLKQENAHLEEQKRVERTHLEDQHQVLSQQYHDSQRTVEELREEIRKLKNQQLIPLPSQPGAHIVSRGVGPLCLKAQDIKLPPELALANDIVEKDGYPTPLRSDFTNGNGDSGYSSGKHQFQHQQQHQHHHQQHQQPYQQHQQHHHHQQEHHQQHKQQYQQHQQHQQQYSQHRQEEDAREELVQSPHQSLPVGGSYRFDATDDFSDLERSASLPPPLLGGRQRTLSSESETSFQPNQRYIGDGINREIKQQAKHYKEGLQRGMPVADEVDERLWPYDPNLVCPHCGKRFRHGQIREFRYHIDDEHPPSLT